MRKFFLLVALILSCQIFPHNAAHAQSDSPTPLTVGVYVSEPFVMLMDDGSFQGLAIELWETISKSLGISSEYIRYYTFKEMFEATLNQEIDIILTNLTVTYERASLLTMSYPWFDAGIRVMVNKEYENTVFSVLRESGRFGTYLLLIALMVTLTLLITLVRRHIDTSFTKEWKIGLSQSFHAMIRAAKSGEISPPAYLGWIGYILSAMWMVVGVAIMVYVTSTLTVAMTSVYLHPKINSLYDLPGRAIGVVSGSVSEDFMRSMGIDTKGYDSVAAAIDELHAKKIDAVVAPAPVLEYWAHSRPHLDLLVVGNLFHPEKYAFAANETHKDLMNAISLNIIKMHDSGELLLLKSKYFGTIR